MIVVDDEEEECSTIVVVEDDDGWFERRGLGVANALMMMDGSSWIRRRMRERILVSDFIVSASFKECLQYYSINYVLSCIDCNFVVALVRCVPQ